MSKKKKDTVPMEYDTLHSSSFQDMTDLIPAGPVEESELREYYELYSIYPKIPRNTEN